MKLNYTLYYIYLLALLLCILFGAREWRRMDAPMRIFFVLIVSIVSVELGALIIEYNFGSNTEFYNAADILQSMLIFWYFSISLKKHILGALIIGCTLLFGLYNFYFVQQQSLINNYFLLWNGAIVIGLCLYQMITLAQKDNSIKLYHNAHFLIATALLFYWVMNMLNFQVFNFFARSNEPYAIVLNVLHQCSNIITYLAFAMVFLYLSKLIQ